MMRRLRQLTLGFALAGAGLALLVGAMTTVSVVGRALANLPVAGDVEMTQMGMAIAIALCLPWCQLRGANIIVDFFTQRVPARGRTLLDAAGNLLLAAMYLLLAWRAGVGAGGVREASETTMILALPMWWAYAALAPGLALAAVVALVQAGRQAAGRSLAPLVGEGA